MLSEGASNPKDFDTDITVIFQKLNLLDRGSEKPFAVFVRGSTP
jgi:hypothetical protein